MGFDPWAGKKQDVSHKKRQQDDKPSGHEKGEQKNGQKKSDFFSFNQQECRAEKQHRHDISDNLHHVGLTDHEAAGPGQDSSAGHAGAEPQQA